MLHNNEYYHQQVTDRIFPYANEKKENVSLSQRTHTMWPEVQHISSDLVHGTNGAKGLTIHVLDGVQTMIQAVRSG